ncbi:Type 1 glutamine amidotransferase-like domain-containing protein [Shewanella sp. 202IG2-18]|uniref:Type 1 glutamine amidotransferase-like domain-containing protein n=1 Tax=Parashewanella hymeniacidonis TaxID=2807618 RepID=UPI00195FCC99|nr:Type 1 glutamine amidotransferase-like domain-containing protein [Parashewanella hymeniacidonis]MBM7074471.1 Type 1 glutamine amidotransferase-like domain-containing protein [Parashewanella hymeniacidonis]
MLTTHSRKGKLVLLSQHESENSRLAIQEALGKKAKNVGYLASQPDSKRTYFTATQRFYKELGYKMEAYLELEGEFNSCALEVLLAQDAIHLSGGDTFRFLEFVKERNLDNQLIEFYLAGGVLIGVSAGAMILTPSIETAEFCGDINSRGLQDLAGLCLTDFCLVPHVEDKFILLETGKAPINAYLMGDNDALVIESNQKLFIFGAPIFQK